MPELCNVDSDRIMAAVSQLDGIVNSIAGGVGKIREAMAALDKGWMSGVKEEFMTRYRTDEEAMGEMLEQYREVSEQLKDIARDFDRTESEILGSISELR